MDFLMRRAKILHIASSTLEIRWAAMRFVHIVHGFGRFPVKAFRARALMKGITKGRMVRRKITFGTDLLRWMSRALGNGEERNDAPEWVTAAIAAFFFLMSVGTGDDEAIGSGIARGAQW